jgi:prefoldin subunit 5
MYDSPRDTGPQLRKFLAVLAEHKRQLEEQLAEVQANLDEVKVHEKEARALLARLEKKPLPQELGSNAMPALESRP